MNRIWFCFVQQVCCWLVFAYFVLFWYVHFAHDEDGFQRTFSAFTFGELWMPFPLRIIFRWVRAAHESQERPRRRSAEQTCTATEEQSWRCVAVTWISLCRRSYYCCCCYRRLDSTSKKFNVDSYGVFYVIRMVQICVFNSIFFNTIPSLFYPDNF